MSRSVIHDFAERLEYSARLSDEAAWVAFYRRLWPDLISCVRIDADSKWQRWGVDRMVILPGGRQVLIDEKKREKDWGDVLLEVWSVWYGPIDSRNKPGWAVDPEKRCDFVAYAVIPTGRCYFLPLELVRQACRTRLDRWKLRAGAWPKIAANNGYETHNVAVSWPELRAALCEQMLRRWGSGALPLPGADTSNAEQTLFPWGEP